jgi:N-acetylglucosaminyldiphosphoundecaprenol N-acetyl-beta-D-mannosaminyltransferase
VKNVDVLGVRIERATKGLLVEELVGYFKGEGRRSVAKINAEFLVRSLNDDRFRAVLNGSDLNIADGVGVVWAARFLTLRTTSVTMLARAHVLWQALYSLSSLLLFPELCRFPIAERLPGVDALYLMLEAAQRADASVYFLGASSEVNSKAREQIQARFPHLKIAGGRDGYWTDDSAVVEQIVRSQPGLLVVALGSPKQEYWISENLSRLGSVKVAVGEGGSLDFIAGEFRRAPRWMRELGLEWFWRLFMNRSKTKTGSRPRRVWNAVPLFIYRVVAWKLTYGPTRVET